MKINSVYAIIVGAAVLSSCASHGGEEKETYTESMTYSVTSEAPATTAEGGGFLGDYTVQTLSKEETLEQLFSRDIPEINISDDMSDEEIMAAGKTAANFYGDAARDFFNFSSYIIFKEGDQVTVTDENGDTHYYYEAEGLRTNFEEGRPLNYVDMDYEETKALIINSVHTTEQGFTELCENSPTGYYEIDSKLCYRAGDGGNAGHSYNYIDSYVMDGDTVTFNCVAVGLASEWGYAEDMTWDYTFRLKKEDGEWKLDGVSDGVFLMEGSIGNYEDKLLHDELLNDFLPVYDSIIRINELGIIAYDEKDVKTVDGKDYCRVTDERFLTWKSWTDYVKSVYTDEAAEEALKSGRTIEQDGLFYINGKINGEPSGGYYMENTERTADGGASTTVTITDFTRHKTLKRGLNLARTDDGLRVISESIIEVTE